jgi:nucleoside-diphosphate-sugar epimerase
MPQKGNSGPFEFVDVTAQRQIDAAVRRHDIDTIYHLAAILSAVAEEKPHVAWDVNMGGLYRTLEVARASDPVRRERIRRRTRCSGPRPCTA